MAIFFKKVGDGGEYFLPLGGVCNGTLQEKKALKQKTLGNIWEMLLAREGGSMTHCLGQRGEMHDH